MIREFNILDRTQNIHSHCLLEASAGTGKTFAVENLVVRLLLEEGPSHDPLTLDQILVVTFTRAATRDLKARIRSKISECLSYFTHRPDRHSLPDYLQSILEMGKQPAEKARRNLERALFCFDQAQIFTIHGFCHRLLQEHIFESGTCVDTREEHKQLPMEKRLQIIQDYLRLRVNPSFISCGQFSKLADSQDALEKVKKKLLKEVSNGHALLPLRHFKDQFHDFCRQMAWLQGKGYDQSDKIIEDFQTQAPFYKGICDIKKTSNLRIWLK